MDYRYSTSRITLIFALLLMASACGTGQGGSPSTTTGDASGGGADIPGSGGLAPNGGDCTEDLQCESGRCASSVCIAPYSRTEGQACDHNADCVEGLICNFGAGHTCAPPGLPGQPCGHATDCRVGYACDLALLGSHTCECALTCGDGMSCGLDGCVAPGLVPAGEPCAYNANCAAGLICAWFEAPYACRSPSALGEPCGHDTDCAAGLGCDEGAGVCRVQCTSAVTCEAGQVCTCTTNFVCLGDDGALCQEVRADGDACTTPTQCAATSTCVAKKCVAGGQAGAGCDQETPCASGFRCLESTCQPPSGLGGACTLDLFSPVLCAEGLACRVECDDSECSAIGACSAPAAEGEPCPCPEGTSANGCLIASAAAQTCAEGLECTGDANATMGLCTAAE